jgi:glucose-6-phosphate 1-epimerase
MSGMNTISPDALNEQFALDDQLQFTVGRGGLVRAAISNTNATGEVYLHGGHITAFTPTEQELLLFVSSKSYFEDGLAIKGGVPICFPWFADAREPMHGPVRTRSWDVTNTMADGQNTTIELATSLNPYVLTLRVGFGAALTMELAVTNSGDEPVTFEEALHTYLHVKDVRKISLSGLKGTKYYSKVRKVDCTDECESIRFAGKTDRVYHDTQATCVLDDPGFSRRITVSKENSNSTVIWNPWMEMAAQMKDLEDNEWKRMLCIETANVEPASVALAPGQTHQISATISAQPL